MTTRIAINGFGRIGRLVARALMETPRDDIELVSINNPSGAATAAHLFKYDSVHGTYRGKVEVESEDVIIIDGKKIRNHALRNPEDLPWAEEKIDIVLECTGKFCTKEGASKHLTAGAKKVLISAPAKDEVDATVVFGVNHDILTSAHKIVSNASCTTNCLAPIAKVLHESIGIERGLMTTIHAYTNDQNTLDNNHKDMRRARAAALSMIPTSTGAAKAVGLVLPELKGKLDGFSLRVPTPNVSVVDLTFVPSEPTTVEEVNAAVRASALSDMEGIIEINDAPLVSIDFNHMAVSTSFDASQTRVLEDGNLVKIMAWYDNEWGFSQRMIDIVSIMGKLN